MRRLPGVRETLAFALVAGGASTGFAQRPSVLAGSVLRDADDAPVRGAEVLIPGLGISVLSDSTGAFRLPAIAPGKQIVWVRKLGFTPLTAVLTFTTGDTLERDFLLVASAQALPQVDVKAAPHRSAKLAEFEERRKEGFGHFIDQATLEKNENRRLGDIMRTVPGLQAVNGTSSQAFIAGGRLSNRGPNRPCWSAVVLDGIFVYQGVTNEPLWDINSLQPSSVAGIEYYAGGATMPVKYNSARNTCGLVVIWTK